MPDPREISVSYERDYFSGDGSFGYSDYVEQGEAMAALAERRVDFVCQFTVPGRLLDVGCATGEFVAAMHRRGWQAVGVEVSKYVSDIARERTALEVITGTLQECAVPVASFDFITMWDVLEHVSDPLAELRGARRILAPMGLLLICTPNVRSLRALREKGNWHGFRASLEHLYFFSPATLRRLLWQAGFQPVIMMTTGIDGDIWTLLNPYADCSNSPVSLLPQRYEYDPGSGKRATVRRWLERLEFGHTMTSIYRFVM